MRRSGRNTSMTTVILLIVVVIAYFFFRNNGSTANLSPNQASPGATSAAVTGTIQWGHQAKTSGCQVNGKLPDRACTPGDIMPNATKAEICQSGYASSVRNVTTQEKDAVYSEYGIASHTSGEYEVDHLVSLELGGSNDISNLWPEAASPTPGFHQKDEVENYVHEQVCSGAISLADAQKQIATNWLAIYQNMPK
ncbi:MAG TPA: HNH endonuclease signature motif containing protein [Anaerolineaceae bacterium]